MENGTFSRFTWIIKNFSKLDSKKLYSENFLIGGQCHTWRILLFPKGNKVTNYLSVYLDAGALVNLPSDSTKFTLAVINQANGKDKVIKETEHQFNAREMDWGFGKFMPLGELCDSSNGFLVNDTCIIEAEIWVSKSKEANEVEQVDSKNDVLPASKKVCDDPDPNELVDFRCLGKIEKNYVPLVEEVCSRYPSLIECQQKRSRRFTEWSFTALGRVLHFLKTKKVKDMNDDAFNHLQVLWEELETCKFDLTWLEPHIQSAIGIKSYKERAAKMKRMKEDVDALHEKRKRLKSKIAAVEFDLEIAERDLVKAEEGFKEKDSEAELGYGGP